MNGFCRSWGCPTALPHSRCPRACEAPGPGHSVAFNSRTWGRRRGTAGSATIWDPCLPYQSAWDRDLPSTFLKKDLFIHLKGRYREAEAEAESRRWQWTCTPHRSPVITSVDMTCWPGSTSLCSWIWRRSSSCAQGLRIVSLWTCCSLAPLLWRRWNSRLN